jgi:hypothetical protein
MDVFGRNGRTNVATEAPADRNPALEGIATHPWSHYEPLGRHPVHATFGEGKAPPGEETRGFLLERVSCLESTAELMWRSQYSSILSYF